MIPEDNIEKFFKKILKDSASLEEEWSIPSDDLWESAKVHFPKKKKKDRALYWWWGMGLCLLLVSSGIAFYIGMESNTSTEEVLTNQVAGNNNFEDHTNQAQDDIAITQGEIATKEIVVSEAITAKEETIKKQTNNQKATNKLIKKTNIAGAYRQDSANEIDNNSKTIAVKSIEDSTTGLGLELAQNTTEKIDLFKSAITTNIPSKEIVLNKLVNPINLLAIPERTIETINSTLPVIVPVVPTFSKWEIGLTHSPFLFFRESILNNGLEADFGNDDGLETDSEVAKIRIKHQNINLGIRRQFHPRFSISSGLYLSKGKLDINFVDNFIYEKNTSSSLRSFLKASNTSNEFKFSDIGVDLNATIGYRTDADLINGDQISVKGEFSVEDMQFVQMPLLLNVHVGKRRLKGLFHGGISMDYLRAEVKTINLEIFKEEVLVSEPIIFKPNTARFFKFRWQAGFSTRYAINDFLQLGTGISVNITEPILSRYEMGVYYGF